MDITQTEVDGKLTQARRHYENSKERLNPDDPDSPVIRREYNLKSSNKIYLEPATLKQYQRNSNAWLAGKAIPKLRASAEDMSFLEYGKYLVENSIRYGNCEEYAATALYYLLLSDPIFAAKVQHAHVVYTTGDPKHGVVMFGNGPDKPRHGCRISEFNATNSRGLWVFDIYMNYAGPAELWQKFVENSMDRFDSKVKGISDKIHKEGGMVMIKGDYDGKSYASKLIAQRPVVEEITHEERQRLLSSAVLTEEVGTAAQLDFARDPRGSSGPSYDNTNAAQSYNLAQSYTSQSQNATVGQWQYAEVDPYRYNPPEAPVRSQSTEDSNDDRRRRKEKSGHHRSDTDRRRHRHGHG